MGFWSGLGKGLKTVGKVGLKVAPFAAMAIPGVGPAVGGVLKGIGTGAKIAGLAGAAGSALSAKAKTDASNRGAKMEALLAQNQLNLQGAQNRRQQESDSLRKLAQAGYLKSGGHKYTPPAGSPAYGFGPRGASEAQMQAAANLETELLKRMQGGDYTPMDIMQHANPGLGERIAGLAGAGLTGLDAYQQLRQQQPPMDQYGQLLDEDQFQGLV